MLDKFLSNYLLKLFEDEIVEFVKENSDIEHDKDEGTHSSLMKTGPNTVFLAYAGKGGDGFIKSFNIPD